MKKIAQGYTIIELVVVIAIIGVLAAITIVGYTSVQQGTRNTRRSTGLVAVSEALEKYYSKNGEYPACAAIVGQTANQVVTNTLIGLNPADLTAPTDAAGTNSFTSCTLDPDSPAKYSYLTTGGTTFTLKYKEEGGVTKTAAIARHTVPSTNFSIALKVISPSGSVNGAGSYASGATPTITATPDAYYDFVSWTGSAGCSGANGANTHTITMDGYKQCFASFEVTPITAPAQPTVSANTVGATTTFSWGAAACGGNTAEYQYRYTITPSGFNSGILTTGTPSLAFTTSTEGETYTVSEVKARCYNTATTSAWSTGVGGTASYYRPIPQCTLTISGGANGSVNTAVNGSYNCGLTIKDSPTITASPNTYYYATWAGSSGCVTGAASHTILMDGNKTCTASFTAITITPPTPPTVTANTVGATTTFSWGAAACGGNTARYQYDYTITPSGYDSGWTATASTSVAFTTSTEGQAYQVTAKAECYNTATQSGMSAAGGTGAGNPYNRPFTLTYVAGANGSLTGTTTQSVVRGGNGTAVTPVPATYYSFVNWTPGGSTANPRTDTNVTAAVAVTANFTPTAITVPAPPVTSGSTVGASTTFSWPAASCGGNTARYQYKYTINGAIIQDFTATAATSVVFTTSTEGQTYQVVAKAECYNTATSSGMSAAGGTGAGNPYYRPIPQCTLTISGGANGSVNTAVNGSYNCGLTIKDSPTITASPNTYYYATWAGSSGCVTGAASHTILMDGNKTCTASFAPITITVPTPPTVTASTVGATTTFSWTAASCPGNTARYHYLYTITPSGYSSDVPTPTAPIAATSVAFTTSTQGEQYKVLVQAECYNTATGSGMSAYGGTGAGNPYNRPFTLTYVAGANGSLTGTTTQSVVRGGNGTAVTPVPATYYSFVNWTPGGSTANPRTDTNVTAAVAVTANFTPTAITVPAPPVTSGSTVGASTTFSWPAASCGGNTARYQYRYTYTPAGDSGWVATAATSVVFTTSTENQTYGVVAKAECYNTATQSGMSAEGETSPVNPYYRPITINVTSPTASTIWPTGSTQSLGFTLSSAVSVGELYSWLVNTVTGTWYGGWLSVPVAGQTVYARSFSTVGIPEGTYQAAVYYRASVGGDWLASGWGAWGAATISSNWIAIGTQVWAKANLNVGTMVTGVTTQTNNSILEKYCSANTESNCTTYDALYQWDEAMQYVTTQGAQGICPAGSHIPSDNDWKILEMQLGMTQAHADTTGWSRGTDQGTQLKSGGTSGLNIPTAGYRSNADGFFYSLSAQARLWSSSESSTNAWARFMENWGYTTVRRDTNPKSHGFSVRCMGN